MATIEIDGNKWTILDQVSYENTADGSYKFWKSYKLYIGQIAPMRAVQYGVYLHWGRLDHPEGHTKLKIYGSEAEAESFFQSRIKDKMKKGYVRIANTDSISKISTKKSDMIESQQDKPWNIF